MYLTALSLTNFRNYRAVALPLTQGLTIFTGPNGAGKSNLLEAIHCLATGRSYRARSETELRSFAPDPERPYTRVAGDVAAGENTTTLEVIWAAEHDQDAGVSKRIRIGGAPRRASSLLQHLHVVLFTPHDIALVDGSPSTRRRYLDYLLSRIDRSPLWGSLKAPNSRFKASSCDSKLPSAWICATVTPCPASVWLISNVRWQSSGSFSLHVRAMRSVAPLSRTA